MPYIKQQDREYLRERNPHTAGELNYLITQLIISYMNGGKECYQAYNDCLGALEGAKLELYRRKIAPYENKAIEKNGDVYED